MGPTPDRLRTMRQTTALVALDTIDILAGRVMNLLSHGRRITVTRRYTYVDEPPEVTAGLTLDGEPKVWKRDDGAGFGVHLKPGLLSGFGFSCYAHEGNTTEEEAWTRYRAGKSTSGNYFERRRDVTEVRIGGGLPGDGPARDDELVIRHWNGDGVCDERVVAFDYDTGRHNDLTKVRDELREHMANIGDKQPWDNKAMFDRVLAALEANAAVTGGED